MDELKVFDFEENDVRILNIEDTPYFVGNDVAKILGYSNYRNAVINHVEAEDRLSTRIEYAGQNRMVTVINESGLYSLIFGSKLDSAKRFKRWVTSEVLPTLRRTGTYEVTKDPLEIIKLSMKAIEQTNEEVENLKDDVTYLKDEVKLDAGEYGYISRLINRTVMESATVYGFANTKEVKKELFSDINRGINEICGIRTRTQLRQKHFDKATQYINVWTPSTATRMKVQQLTMDIEEEQP